MKSVTTTSGTTSRTISYDYDLLGNKVSMTTPGGSKIGYGYDILSRLSTVTHPDSAVTTFGYDKVGNRLSVTRTNAAGTVFSTTGYGYDTLNRLTDITNKNASSAVVSSFHYGLRLDGKRGSVTDASGLTVYTYDDSGKLVEEAGPYADIKYGYDNVGNRLTRTVTGSTTALLPNGTTTSTYDQNDRLTSGSHTYGADGNETTVNGQAASYDFENHLVSLGSVANYIYDADGNRVSASSGGATTSYAVDTSLPYASVVEEYAGTSATPSARYDYGDDLVRMDRGSGVYYYLYDGLGSTRQLVNASGTVTDSYGYSAFGELASHTGSTVNPFLFNAQQFDQASGDYFLRARYYDQTSGRFISQDPYSGSNSDPVSLHRYMYAHDDSVDRVDPSGNFDVGLFATTVATAISDQFDSLQSSVYLRSITFAARNPGLVRLALYATGALNFYTLATDPDALALSAATGGFTGDVEAVINIAQDARQAFTLYKDAVDVGSAFSSGGAIARLTPDVLKLPNSREYYNYAKDLPGYDDIQQIVNTTGKGGSAAQGHIIGDQLGGPGSLKENFVAMFQSANLRMKTYEGQIARQLKAGNTVYYDVTPIYQPGTAYPVQIKLEAKLADGRGAFADGSSLQIIDNKP